MRLHAATFMRHYIDDFNTPRHHIGNGRLIRRYKMLINIRRPTISHEYISRDSCATPPSAAFDMTPHRTPHYRSAAAAASMTSAPPMRAVPFYSKPRALHSH